MKSAVLGAPLLLLLLVQLIAASPIRYDQRQDGDSNVDARLQNFFVVLAPTNTAQLGSTGVSLLDLASKAVPLRLRPQGIVGVGAAADGLKQREEVDADTTGQVKETKSGRSVQAVAIPAAILQSPLAKLHPEVQALNMQEVLIDARSPVVALRSPPAPVPAALGLGVPPGAVPMLVAVPVPEVAPERPAAPLALLPMHPATLADKQTAAEAAPAIAIATPEGLAASEAIAASVNTISDPASADSDAKAESADIAAAAAPAIAAPAIAAPAIVIPAEAVTADLAAAAIAAPVAEAAPSSDAAPALTTPIEVAAVEPAPPAVETNQVEPEAILKDAEVAVEASKVHLIGTGIEECGPERIRNNEGVCVNDPAASD